MSDAGPDPTLAVQDLHSLSATLPPTSQELKPIGTRLPQQMSASNALVDLPLAILDTKNDSPSSTSEVDLSIPPLPFSPFLDTKPLSETATIPASVLDFGPPLAFFSWSPDTKTLSETAIPSASQVPSKRKFSEMTQESMQDTPDPNASEREFLQNRVPETVKVETGDHEIEDGELSSDQFEDEVDDSTQETQPSRPADVPTRPLKTARKIAEQHTKVKKNTKAGKEEFARQKKALEQAIKKEGKFHAERIWEAIWWTRDTKWRKHWEANHSEYDWDDNLTDGYPKIYKKDSRGTSGVSQRSPNENRADFALKIRKSVRTDITKALRLLAAFENIYGVGNKHADICRDIRQFYVADGEQRASDQDCLVEWHELMSTDSLEEPGDHETEAHGKLNVLTAKY